jgi:hypothetical protein
MLNIIYARGPRNTKLATQHEWHFATRVLLHPDSRPLRRNKVAEDDDELLKFILQKGSDIYILEETPETVEEIALVYAKRLNGVYRQSDYQTLCWRRPGCAIIYNALVLPDVEPHDDGTDAAILLGGRWNIVVLGSVTSDIEEQAREKFLRTCGTGINPVPMLVLWCALLWQFCSAPETHQKF